MELLLLLLLPVAGAAVLGVIGAHRRAPEVNALISVGTFLAACALTARVIRHGTVLLGDEQFFIDPFNVFLVALTAFVGMTTALFSRPYMRIELDHGRLSAGRLRLYHSMYQLFMFTMLLALTTNNMGLMWVAMEGATLSTVLLVTLYRTPGSLEAGWKYFILCGVGIAQALFGTVLLYMAAEKLVDAENGALLWTNLNAVKSQLEPTVLKFNAHVRPRKERRGHADERRQRDQKDVERIDEELLIAQQHSALVDHPCGERTGGQERPDADQRIDLRRPPVCADHPQHGGARHRQQQQQQQCHVSRAP